MRMTSDGLLETTLTLGGMAKIAKKAKKAAPAVVAPAAGKGKASAAADEEGDVEESEDEGV